MFILSILLQGYAYTFITEDQARYAGDIIKALELSGTTVPQELEKLWTDFKDQQKAVSYPFYRCCWFQIAYLNPDYVLCMQKKPVLKQNGWVP